MRDAIQSKQRSEQLQGWCATVVVAGLLAMLLACITEALLMLWGVLVGDLAWHRSWGDQRFASSIAWLANKPIFGFLVASLGGLKDLIPSNGCVRNLLVFGLVFFSWMLAPGRRLGPTLMARYDSETLRPPPTGNFSLNWDGPRSDAQVDAWQQLHAWCYAGTGSGRSPFWRPWVVPDVTQRFSIAVLAGDNGVGKSHLAEALSRKLDGSLQLEACTSRFESIRLRLRVKYDNCRWWRSRQDSDPWDSGYLQQGAVAQSHLAVFAPRRATLIVADELAPQSLIPAIEALNARRSKFHHPVRLIIVSTVLPASLGLCWDAAGAVWTHKAHELGEVPVIHLS